MKRYTHFYIDGQWVDPAPGARSCELIDPPTEQAFPSVPMARASTVPLC